MSGGGPEDDPFPYWLGTSIVVLVIAAVMYMGALEVVVALGGGSQHSGH